LGGDYDFAPLNYCRDLAVLLAGPLSSDAEDTLTVTNVIVETSGPERIDFLFGCTAGIWWRCWPGR